MTLSLHLAQIMRIFLLVCILTVSNTLERQPIFKCYGESSTNPNVCSGNGKCIGPEICQCYFGFYGPQCQYFNCFQYPNWFPLVCSSKGLCTKPNTCDCLFGWHGPECSLLNQTHTPPQPNNSLNSTGTIHESKVFELNSKDYTISNSTTVQFPSNIGKYLQQQGISPNESVTILTTYENSEIFLGGISSVSITRSNGSIIQVNGLVEPIQIAFHNLTITFNTTINDVNTLNFTCVYFDDQTQNWQTRGVETEISNIKVLESRKIELTIHCKTKHLTRFTILDTNFQKVNPQNDKDLPDIPPSETTIIIVAIVTSSVGACLIICIMLALVCVSSTFLKRRNKPRKAPP